MDLERWIRNALKIQSIAAPTFQEQDRAAFILGEFSTLKLSDVSSDEKHNVFARIPGASGRPLIVTAHLDTVFPPGTDLSHKRESNRIYGPGIGDNAIAVAALLELAHDLRETTLPNDVWLVANVCEEGLGNLIGMRNVVERFGKDVRAYLILEGMALGHIYHRGLPVHRYRISAKTPGGHSWIHAGRPSAIHIICQLGSILAQLNPAADTKWSLNIGRIHGGTSINTIAAEAMLELDLRAESGENLQRLERMVIEAIETFRAPDVQLELEGIGNRPAGGIPANHPLVEAACQALHEFGISDCQFEMGSTDASVPLSLGIPAICIGLTFGSGAHSLGEYIEIPPLGTGYKALRATIEAILTLD